MILIQLSLLPSIFSLLLPQTLPSVVPLNPGCPDRCGNLPIPYPFGIGADCSHDPSFDLICDNTTNPPKPYLGIYHHMEVVEIMPSQVRVTNPYLLSVACYDEKTAKRNAGEQEHSWTGISLKMTQYTFSDDNWLTAIGCDDLVLGIGEGDQRFGGGCVSYCNDSSNSSDFGFCSDDDAVHRQNHGCCRNTVPKGMTMLGVQFIDLSNKWRDKKLFPCSYAFVAEKAISNHSGFSYPLFYLNSSTAFANDNWRNANGALPVMRFDWRIGEENCSQAQLNPTKYACRDNTVCIDYQTEVVGYLCSCMDGYQGNPYIRCQDIDECFSDNPCDSNAVCINTSGSFDCYCPKWYYGDGRKDGKGCIPSRVIYVLIGVASGLGNLLLLSMCMYWHKKLQKRKKRRCKHNFFRRNGGLLLQNNKNEGTSTIRKTKLFSVEELEKATDNFSKSRLIGQGGQGRVYKGMLSDGSIVAIKQSKLVNKDLLEQFINEVLILSHINHKNVVKLLGCCLETEVPLLVYECMPNGTLSSLIHDPKIEFPISWNIRFKMAADIAGALMYLHSASSRPIYHRDIKSSNILLDEKYVVKISDFGISRFVEDDQTHLTTKVKGTFGYFDPEYFQSHQFTEKSDVYSFGVVLLELLTGQKPVSSERKDEESSLVTRFLFSVEENNLDAILDSRVSKEGVRKEMIAVALLAHRCLNLNGKMRPTMKEVATNLESLRMSQMSTAVDDKYKENGFGRAKSVKISDSEYTWAGSGEVSSSSDTINHSKLTLYEQFMCNDDSTF